MKLAVVTPTPTPYRDPFWNTVATQPDVDLTVFYCRRVTADRPWNLSWHVNFRAEYLAGFAILPNNESYWNPAIWRQLKDGRFDALILGGYNHLTMLAAALYAVRHRVPYFLMSEVYLKQPRARWRKYLKTPVVRWVVRHAAGFFPTGSLAAEYLQFCGANPDNICHVPNSPDFDSLSQAYAELLPQRPSLRAGMGFGKEPVLLFVGRLLELKQVHTLLAAIKRVSASHAVRLAIIGDGPERPRLERIAGELGISQRVSFLGFKNPNELPKWYTACDLFVLPSSDETWGVVVLEALSFGLPVIVSDMVGCYKDVVVSPAIGEVVPAKNVGALAGAIANRVSQPARVPAEVWRPVQAALHHRAVSARMVGLIRRVLDARARISSEL